MPRTRVKICGIRDVDTALAVADAGADAVGFVFVKSSPRFIEPEAAWEIMSSLPPFVGTVGVFVNASVDQFCDVEERCPTTFSQLQGSEDEATVRQCGPNVIRAIRFDASTIEAELARWDGIDEVDALLVDGSVGGAGTGFDWAHLAPHSERMSKPLIVAGGLTSANVGDAIRALRPFAVDVSSGVDSAPGIKDPELIRRFCDAVRRADGAG